MFSARQVTYAQFPTLSVRRAAVILLLVIGVTYAVPFLLGFSLLPTPGFPASPPPLPRYPYGYDTFSFSYLHLPYRHLAIDAVRRGELPLWNPYNWFGIPIPAQYEVQVLSPLEWLDWLGGMTWWNLLLVAKIWFASFGVFLLTRRLVGPWEGLTAGLLYMFGSFFVGFNSMEAFFNHAVILPWLFYFILSAFGPSSNRISLLGAGGLLFGLLFTTGQPQIAALNLIGLAVFTLAQALRAGRSWANLQGMLLVLAGGGLGLLASSLQLAFFNEALQYGYTIHPPGAYSGGGTSPLNFTLPLTPLAFGQLMAPWLAQMYPGKMNPEAFPFILGVSGGVLACSGLLGLAAGNSKSGPPRSPIVPLVIIAAVFVGLIIAGTLGYGSLWSHPPLNRINLPRYSGPMLSLCFAVIGGFGFSWLMHGGGRYRAAVCTLAVAIVAVHQFFLWPYLHQPTAQGVDTLYHTKSIWLSETIIFMSLAGCVGAIVLARTPLAWVAVLIVTVVELSLYVRYGFNIDWELRRLVVGGLGVTAALLWSRERRTLALGTLVGAVTLVYLLFWTAPNRLVKRRDYAAQSHPAITFLRGQLGPFSQAGRTLSTQRIMIPNSLSTFGIAQVSGLNPVQIGTVAQFIRETITSRGINYTLPVAWQGAANDPTGDWLTWQDYFAARPLFNRLNVRFLIDGVKGELSQANWPGLERVYTDSQYAIYEDHKAFPRAYFVPAAKAIFAVSLPDALGKVAERHALNEDWLVVETEPLTARAETTVGSPALVTIKGYDSTHVSLEASTSASGYVVLTDADYPGWTATIDNHPTSLLRAQGIVRAVAVPPGSHRIDFYYRPRPLDPWLLVSMVGWLFSGGLIINGMYLSRHALPKRNGHCCSLRTGSSSQE